jgi:drug/metabolite transporter (DMT)-like permease
MGQKNLSLVLAFLTISLWASLATFGKLLLHLPPFYILGAAFMIGSLPGFFHPREMFPSIKTLGWGVFGYFGYHFCLFYAFRHAPVLEANLLNYLWPVILVLISPLFFKEFKIKIHHIFGGVLSILGCFILVTGFSFDFKTEHLFGYLLALSAAFIWPIFSLGKKRLPQTSIWTIAGFCFISGLLCFFTHFLIEPRVVLQWHDAWKILVMGIGPFGIAFYTWDIALKYGDSRIIGALSYLTPVLSTFGLVMFTNEDLKSATLMAMFLIMSGSSLGVLDIFPRKR